MQVVNILIFECEFRGFKSSYYHLNLNVGIIIV